MKSTMILPCGVRRAAKRGLALVTLLMSAVTRPVRSLHAIRECLAWGVVTAIGGAACRPVGILGAMRMSGEIISLRMLAVFGSERDGELMRQGATLAAIPGELTPVTATAAARSVLAE